MFSRVFSSLSIQYTSFLKSLQDNISSIASPDYQIIILADFNLSSIKWQSMANGSLSPVEYLSNDLNGMNAAFVQSTECFSLLQFNDNQNHVGRILDLFLSDICPEQIKCTSPATILSEPVDIHHPPFQVDVDIPSKSSP